MGTLTNGWNRIGLARLARLVSIGKYACPHAPTQRIAHSLSR